MFSTGKSAGPSWENGVIRVNGDVTTGWCYAGSMRTERLVLRHWHNSDRQAFARLNADARVMEFMPSVLSEQESNSLVDRMEAHFQEHGFGLYAAELQLGGCFIGYIGLSVPTFQAAFTPCVEIGWRLSREYWGQGLAT